MPHLLAEMLKNQTNVIAALWPLVNGEIEVKDMMVIRLQSVTYKRNCVHWYSSMKGLLFSKSMDLIECRTIR